MLPGTAPPTSLQCATEMAKAKSRPPTKIGLISAISQLWVPPSKGSLVMKTSPGRMVSPWRRTMERTCGAKVPVKSVMPLVCTTSSPSASQRPQAKSSTS